MNLKNQSIVLFIKEEIFKAIKKLAKNLKTERLPVALEDINVDKTRNSKFGDFTTNVVMSFTLGNIKKIDAAKSLAELIDQSAFAKIEVAGPGFINFYLNDQTKAELLDAISSQEDDYGKHKKSKL
ncbi:MAG: hypothetical protein MJ195_01135 [Mycoplasmoidaceae bacterium]|nr:hypothetical protein [Mycoplasmoidaceae bacterium]